MTAKVPYFPGKGAPAAQPPQQAPRFCPILTAAELAKPEPQKSLVAIAGVQPVASGPEMIACQGPLCALYVEAKGPNGPIGCCALVMQVMQNNAMQSLMTQFFERVGAGEPAAPTTTPLPVP